MNVNVIVLSVFHGYGVAEAGDRSRGRDEFFGQTAGQLQTPTPEQVIELVPQDGSWAERGGAKPLRSTIYGEAGEPKVLHASPGVATYDQAGKVRYSTLDKGLRVNITA